jgi:class 3 adenylate cyclase
VDYAIGRLVERLVGFVVECLREHVGPCGGGRGRTEGEVTIVFTDITRAASLWEFNAATRDAQ